MLFSQGAFPTITGPPLPFTVFHSSHFQQAPTMQQSVWGQIPHVKLHLQIEQVTEGCSPCSLVPPLLSHFHGKPVGKNRSGWKIIITRPGGGQVPEIAGLWSRLSFNSIITTDLTLFLDLPPLLLIAELNYPPILHRFTKKKKAFMLWGYLYFWQIT